MPRPTGKGPRDASSSRLFIFDIAISFQAVAHRKKKNWSVFRSKRFSANGQTWPRSTRYRFGRNDFSKKNSSRRFSFPSIFPRTELLIYSRFVFYFFRVDDDPRASKLHNKLNIISANKRKGAAGEGAGNRIKEGTGEEEEKAERGKKKGPGGPGPAPCEASVPSRSVQRSTSSSTPSVHASRRPGMRPLPEA